MQIKSSLIIKNSYIFTTLDFIIENALSQDIFWWLFLTTVKPVLTDTSIQRTTCIQKKHFSKSQTCILCKNEPVFKGHLLIMDNFLKSFRCPLKQILLFYTYDQLFEAIFTLKNLQGIPDLDIQLSNVQLYQIKLIILANPLVKCDTCKYDCYIFISDRL